MARVLISLKDGFLERVDKVAELEQRSRSELFREALRRYITQYEHDNPTRPVVRDGADNLSDIENAGESF